MIKVLLLVASWPAVTWAQATAPLPRGHVFVQADFEEPDALQPWSGSAGKIVGDQNGHVLLVERPVVHPAVPPRFKSRCRSSRCAVTS